MRLVYYTRGLILLLCYLISGCTESTTLSEQKAPLIGVPFNEVELEDQFWKQRLKVQKETLVPFALEKTKPAVENLAKAAKFLHGDTTDLPFPHRYISSDLYKVMEGAALLLMENPDPELEAKMDSIILIIEAAQQEDGYLYVAHITGVSKDHAYWGGGGMGDRPYAFVVHSHELYNMGHMYEAAIAYYRATGKDRWLKVAEKNAQHINQVFFVGDPNYNDGKPVTQAPGHQEIELALVKLYQVTGKSLYLDMAKKFLDIRGITYKPDGEAYLSPTYAHQHLPVREQEEPVGHAVRATYMYAGMADVAAALQVNDYDTALQKIWHNIVDTKMHITGGLGAKHGIEGFGEAYELPNKDTYNETCAAVGNVLWNYRMYLRHKDARYMDVAEVALFNNALAGVNLEGNRFFYVNPLESDGEAPFNHGKAGRSPWFNTACCPSNIARLIPQVSGMMYAYNAEDIYVSLYASSQTIIPLAKGNVLIKQQSNYPFEEKVLLDIQPEKSGQFINLNLRIPTWVNEQFVPGALYQYADDKKEAWQLQINGVPTELEVEKGFVQISRRWKKEDQVQLILPMPLRSNQSDPRVEANVGKIAFTKGPLVYCAEEVDNGGPVQTIRVEEAIWKEQSWTADAIILDGIPGVQITAQKEIAGTLEAHLLKLIPYFAWNNRGDASMRVWMPTLPEE